MNTATRRFPELGLARFPPVGVIEVEETLGRTGEREHMSGDDWLVSGFGEIYPAHVASFVDLLIVLRREFDGDLDMMLILAVIGDRRVLQQALSKDVSYERLGRTPLPASQNVTINVLSIASFIGMPRETVRRKVAALIERGWIEREENGDLRPTHKAAVDLKAGTDATIEYVRVIAEACDRVRSRSPRK